MKGDIIDIRDEYFVTAKELYAILKDKILSSSKFVIAIAGESGSGKSVSATTFSHELSRHKIANCIIHMDDYFILPPLTNHKNRIKSLKNVGRHEVRLHLLQETIDDFKANIQSVSKPLVDYNEDIIGSEELHFQDTKVLLVEGTYVASLKGIDVLIFMERTYKETFENRKQRNRDEASVFIEKVLEIEHKIISKDKELCDIIIDKNYRTILYKPFEA